MARLLQVGAGVKQQAGGSATPNKTCFHYVSFLDVLKSWTSSHETSKSKNGAKCEVLAQFWLGWRVACSALAVCMACSLQRASLCM